MKSFTKNFEADSQIAKIISLFKQSIPPFVFSLTIYLHFLKSTNFIKDISWSEWDTITSYRKMYFYWIFFNIALIQIDTISTMLSGILWTKMYTRETRKLKYNTERYDDIWKNIGTLTQIYKLYARVKIILFHA